MEPCIQRENEAMLWTLPSIASFLEVSYAPGSPDPLGYLAGQELKLLCRLFFQDFGKGGDKGEGELQNAETQVDSHS